MDSAKGATQAHTYEIWNFLCIHAGRTETEVNSCERGLIIDASYGQMFSNKTYFTVVMLHGSILV